MQNGLNTKQKILEASIRLFNWNDVANVRLQQIADETGISVGNLAYHFKNKEAIVSAVYEGLFDEFAEVLSGYLAGPSLGDFDRQIDQYYRFFGKYKFYLIDLFEIERSHPAILERWRECVGKMLLQIRKRLEYNVHRGTLRPEPAPGLYQSVADNLGMSILFWIPQQMLKGKPAGEVEFKKSVWSHISPYLTPQGLEEFTLDIQPSLRS